MSNRGGGKGSPITWTADEKRCVYRFNSMNEALSAFRSGVDKYADWRKRARNKWQPSPRVYQEIMEGEPRKMQSILDDADRLIERVLLEDPRLVKRPGFEWSTDEGFDACPSRMLSGEENCILNRRASKVADQTHTARCRVVISTDSNTMSASHVAAAIATIKLAQQFRQLEVWWQGAWFRDDREWNGIVFHVPVITGDMDFSRLQFILGDECRDHVSYRIMFHLSHQEGTLWGMHTGERCHMEDYDYFVPESGIDADPWRIARLAAQWAGLPPAYSERVSPHSAEQMWQPPTPRTEEVYTEADRKADEKRWQQYRKEEERRRIEKANARAI